MRVTPWDVDGKIDYDKLVNEFGVQRITPVLKKRIESLAGSNVMLRRNIFFAHRDLKWILDEYEKKNKFFLYTGRGPSGKMHLGHLFPFLFTKWLQDAFDVELYIQFTDDEKFLFKDTSMEEINEHLKENMLDVIALGFNPKKTHFIIDTKHANLLYPQAIKVAKKLTFSQVKSTFGMNESSNIGQIFFTSMQTVPAFLPSVLANKNIPCLIPHAIDQDPHFRLTRDILPKLGYLKPASIQCVFLPPLGGIDGKMSSSGMQEQAIFTTDSPSEIKKKINKYAFSGGQQTLEEHRKKGGNPDIDVSFLYLKFMFEEDDKKLEEIEKKYRSGELLSGELKAILIEKVTAFLTKHQKAREKAPKLVDEFILKA